MPPSTEKRDSPSDLRTCEVTGEQLPVDQMVQFQGKWVGPEGKQILLERLQSGEPTESATLQGPGFWRRFGCFVLDQAIIYFLAIACVFLFRVLGLVALRLTGHSIWRGGRPIILLCVWLLAVYATVVLYFALQHHIWGCTLGKRVGSLRVVTANNQAPGMRASFTRSLLFTLPQGLLVGVEALGGMAIYFHPSIVSSGGLAFGVAALLVLLFGIAWFLADSITLLTDRRTQRSLHDRLTGTRVVFRPRP